MSVGKTRFSRWFVFALVIILGCSDKPPTGPVPGLGSNTVTKYVAIGNSLTAGYQSNALYASGQNYSFPKLIAEQLQRAGAQLQPFQQPLYGDPGSPDPSTGKASRLEILSLSGLVPTIGSRDVNPGAPLNAGLARPYDNLGIPGIPLASFLDTTNFLGNPFFDFVLRPAGGFPKSVFRQLQLLQPDLVAFWLGNNDVLGYATSGGTSPAAPTPTGTFLVLYAQALDTLRDVLPAAKIVVANIPDVTTIPFFTTIGPTLRAQGINSVWGINSIGDTVLFDLQSHYLTLLAQSSLASAGGFSRTNPLPNSVVLDASEILVAQNATNAYNLSIATLAVQENAVLLDANGIFKGIHANGYEIAGEVFTSAYLSGGLFSLDGVHPSSRGYGIVANEIIKLLNSRYGMSIPLVDISRIPGIPTPLGKHSGIAVLPSFSPRTFKDFGRLFVTGL